VPGLFDPPGPKHIKQWPDFAIMALAPDPDEPVASPSRFEIRSEYILDADGLVIRRHMIELPTAHHEHRPDGTTSSRYTSARFPWQPSFLAEPHLLAAFPDQDWRESILTTASEAMSWFEEEAAIICGRLAAAGVSRPTLRFEMSYSGRLDSLRGMGASLLVLDEEVYLADWQLDKISSGRTGYYTRPPASAVTDLLDSMEPVVMDLLEDVCRAMDQCAEPRRNLERLARLEAAIAAGR
jgi:hypothetical protein